MVEHFSNSLIVFIVTTREEGQHVLLTTEIMRIEVERKDGEVEGGEGRLAW